MLRSMYSAVSGLKNYQTMMDVIGNNISNMSTYGFKKSRVSFSDLVSQQLSGASSPQTNLGGINPKQIGLGSTIGSVDTLQTQGSLQTTGRSLDLSISGDGFFIANEGNSSYYTRAGNFYLDKNGNLVTSNGLKVQGYGVDAQGKLNTSKITDLKIDSGTTVAPTATTSVNLSGNLSNTSTSSDNIDVKMNVTDSQGSVHPITVSFTPSGTNQWSYKVSSTDPNLNLPTTNTSNTIKFASDGSLDPNSPTKSITINSNLNNGANPLSINVDLSKITQVNDGNTIAVKNENGGATGSLQSFSIGSSGEISGVYSNGEVKPLGQIALAKFSNPGGLTKEGNNLYKQSNNSGLPNVGLSGNGRGSLVDGSLEMSNVDLSEEFTNMIEAQRGFQANSKVITTSDQILQDLVNLKQ